MDINLDLGEDRTVYHIYNEVNCRVWKKNWLRVTDQIEDRIHQNILLRVRGLIFNNICWEIDEKILAYIRHPAQDSDEIWIST